MRDYGYGDEAGATGRWSVDQLTAIERASAYATVKARYDLRHREHTFLDSHRNYGPILVYAHAGQWRDVDVLVRDMLADMAIAESAKLAASEPVGELDFLDLQ